MKVMVKLDDGAYMPEKAHDTDAGFDLRTPIAFQVYGRGAEVIDTGVHMVLPKGYCGLLVSKSGLNVKHSLTTTGLVDAGYTGSIRVKVYNNGHGVHIFEKGDKISQIMILPVPEVELVMEDELPETERGANGFGSSGR